MHLLNSITVQLPDIVYTVKDGDGQDLTTTPFCKHTQIWGIARSHHDMERFTLLTVQ